MASKLYPTLCALAASGDLKSNGRHNGGFRLLATQKGADFLEGRDHIAISQSPMPGEGLVIHGLNVLLGDTRWHDFRRTLQEARKSAAVHRG